MTDDTRQLLRYLDGDLSHQEAQMFRARLSESPELAYRLHEMQRIGALVRLWADDVGDRASELLEPTLHRVQQAEQKRARHATLGLALAAVLVGAALPWSSGGQHAPLLAPHAETAPAHGAAIERIEAGDRHAQVFVVGNGSTPVVWLADEAEAEDEAPGQQDPG